MGPCAVWWRMSVGYSVGLAGRQHRVLCKPVSQAVVRFSAVMAKSLHGVLCMSGREAKGAPAGLAEKQL